MVAPHRTMVERWTGQPSHQDLWRRDLYPKRRRLSFTPPVSLEENYGMRRRGKPIEGESKSQLPIKKQLALKTKLNIMQKRILEHIKEMKNPKSKIRKKTPEPPKPKKIEVYNLAKNLARRKEILDAKRKKEEEEAKKKREEEEKKRKLEEEKRKREEEERKRKEEEEKVRIMEAEAKRKRELEEERRKKELNARFYPEPNSWNIAKSLVKSRQSEKTRQNLILKRKLQQQKEMTLAEKTKQNIIAKRNLEDVRSRSRSASLNRGVEGTLPRNDLVPSPAIHRLRFDLFNPRRPDQENGWVTTQIGQNFNAGHGAQVSNSPSSWTPGNFYYGYPG